ncbi:MAG: prevent-host-death family protein [Saprospiraceae bacterium]|jgi:prevent-host-death family protein
MKEISITDLRSNLKEVLDHVKQGKIIQITQRGKVIATVNPTQEDDDEVAFQARLQAYRNGGIQVHDNIVDKPLKQYDEIDDSFYSSSKAAESNE